MTLTAAGLAAAITAQQGAAQDTDLQNEANLALATAIINYITTNAVVVGTAGGNPIVGGAIT